MNVVIREARGTDAAAIAALYRSFVTNPNINVREDRLEAIAADSNNFVFVCEVEGVVCGTAFLTLCLDAMFGAQPYGVLENVVVDGALRGQGIGRRLFEHAEEMCRTRDCSKIMLLSTATRESAHRFFEQQGYSSVNKLGFVKYRRQFRGH
ncbi:MAG: GNAT family N-acetyltransferase [Geobacteraceae bacterium]|nr:GNAT family N-acetyltransferase [Geobacteraceae bacterium]